MSNATIWRAAQERLRREMTSAQFETWLRGTSLHAASDGATILNVRTTFAKELLENRFRERIQSAIAGVTGQPCRLRIAVAPAIMEGMEGTESARCDAAPVMATSALPHASARAHGTHRTRPGDVTYLRPSLFALPDDPTSAPEAPSTSGMPATEGTDDTGEIGESDSTRRFRRYQRPRATPLGGARQRITQANKSAPTSARPVAGARVRAAIERTRASGAPGLARTDQGPVAATEQAGDRGAASRHGSAKVTASTRSAGGETSMPRGGKDERRHDQRAEDQRMPHSHQLEATAGMNDGASGRPAPAIFTAPDAPTSGGTMPPPRLNPRYTFATFIVGSGNQLAHAASLAVAEAPGQAYNPLFLYGGVGLGKTHLLHAIGHTAIERGLSVLYVSSETFTNEIINAIRFRTTEEFRAKYRSVDVLLVDDIQFIAGKDSTEEEFFHTFNSLHEMSKQIVICSDRPPKAIVSLEERLRSRFEWGLTADIQAPDLETRVAILRAKADLLQRHVPDDVITYLAGAVRSNIRELEGSLNRLLAIAQLQGKPLTVETAKSAISNLALDGSQRRVGTDEVLAAVAEYYRIPAEDLQGKQRDKHIVVPRQVAMYLMRQETDASLLEIGQALGGRDHSTVLHGCEKIGREMTENTALRKEVLAIRQQLFG